MLHFVVWCYLSSQAANCETKILDLSHKQQEFVMLYGWILKLCLIKQLFLLLLIYVIMHDGTFLYKMIMDEVESMTATTQHEVQFISNSLLS